MAKILGIFTCYNRKEKTMRCLEGLMEKNTDQDFFFIAVDDNSTDGTRDVLNKYSNVKVLVTDGNCYYTGGMRLGIKEGKKRKELYDWVLLFNDDVDFFPHTISRLISTAENENEILVGALCDNQEKLSYAGVRKKSKFRPAFSIVMSEKERMVCDTFNANCVLIPFDIFMALPNMNENYTHSLGDFDYGLEASKRGFIITVSDFFVGECCDNDINGTWRDTKLTRYERIVKKESPKGLPWKEWFYFVKKHYGVLSACISSITPYIKIIIGRS